MYILAFETTGENASVACIDEKGNIVMESSGETFKHLQRLMPMTKSLLDNNGIAIKDISCVAASAGPGSFTGIRIGAVTAKAFAHAAGIPCLAVPTLPSFVYNIPDYRGLSCPVFDAKRGQIYGGAYYLDNNADIVEVIQGDAYDMEEYTGLLMKKAAELEMRDMMFFKDQKASSTAKLALKLYRAGKQIHYNEFMPLYMRKAEAERKLIAGKNG